MKTFIVLLAGLMVSATTANADTIGDIAKAKCVKCHQEGTEHPTLGAQTKEFLYRSMIDYKTGARHSDGAVGMMAKRVKYLDDATIMGLAEWYSLTPAPIPVAGNPALIAAGKEIYEKGIAAKHVRSCAECHGANGEGRGNNDGLNPRLAGQLWDYLVVQMQNYKAGLIDNQKEMTEIAGAMTDKEVEAVAIYLQSK